MTVEQPFKLFALYQQDMYQAQYLLQHSTSPGAEPATQL